MARRLSPIFFLQLRKVFYVATESFLGSKILSDALGVTAHSSSARKTQAEREDVNQLHESP